MNSHFTAGFASELIKEARLRAGVNKLMARSKDYMRRRRLGKQLGVKPSDVDRVIALRKKQLLRRKILTGGLASGALVAGGMAGKQYLG